jgi:hypothetical protein
VHIGFWLQNLKGRGHLEEQDVDGDNIIVTLKETGWEVGTGFTWLRIRNSGGSCEHGTGPSGFANGRELLDYLSVY